MIHVTFPDGAKRAFEPGVSGLDIAKSISPSLAKRTVAAVRDGVLVDLADPIAEDASLEFISRDDPRALELIRHDAAHVLAEAVQSLWPRTQVTIGPVIENGFYYDFYRSEPFTPEDFPAIEKRMREIVARDRPFAKTVVKALFPIVGVPSALVGNHPARPTCDLAVSGFQLLIVVGGDCKGRSAALFKQRNQLRNEPIGG